MIKKLFTNLLLLLLGVAVVASAGTGKRVLLHITANGNQEAMPLQKGEKVLDAIARFEKNVPFGVNNANGSIDTIRNTVPPINVNFGFGHQDVAFQWFVPATDGNVKELWWWMYNKRGATGKAQIRGWNANASLLTLPANAFDGTGRMGYYVQANDGDGHVTPFKADATDPYFFAGNGSDSTKIKFDPLGTENAWKAGGVQVTPDTAVWNKLVLSSVTGAVPFTFVKGQPFGFTIQNASPTYVDDGAGADIRFEILSGTGSAPYHSIKFYEIPTSATNKPGWQIRSYEWGMYVVIEYTGDIGPKIISVDQLFTTLSTAARTVKAKISDNNPGGGTFGVASANLNWKKGAFGTYAAIAMTGSSVDSIYSGSIPGAVAGDTIFYYVDAKDVNNNPTVGKTYSYTIFKPVSKNLVMYNYRTDIPGFGAKDLASLYYDPITSYDIWNVRSYGIADLATLLPNYDVVVEVAGDGGNSNKATIASAAVDAWLASGTTAKPKLYFFSDQDHGWISNYADTTFDDANGHAKYFGVKTLGPQDYPNGSAKTWNFIVDPAAAVNDSVVSFIKKYATANGISLWYNIKYELSSAFANWADEIKPTKDARVIFRDTTGGKNRVIGVRKNAADKSWSTVYLAFDQLALDFQSDTSKAPASDPKYHWITDAGNMVAKFIANPFFNITGVEKDITSGLPKEFALANNYPNPFNPSTTIKYALPAQANVVLKVYDIIGKEVATLVNENQSAGYYTATFNAQNLSSGLYFYTLRAGSFNQTQKMILLK